MPKKPKPKLLYLRMRRRLPTEHYAGSGRIITRWAIIEYKLSNLIFLALGISHETGRLILRGQRATERISVLKDILDLRNISIDIDWKLLRKHLAELESFRNRLAHNVWVEHPNEDVPVARDLNPEYIEDLPQGRRPKLEPLAVKVPLKKLKNLTVGMETTINTLTNFESSLINLLRSLPHKPELAIDPEQLEVRRRKTQT